MTLQARAKFQQGNMWTLLQWFLACRGKQATDLRDLVFAGLSLVRHEGLLIDASLQMRDAGPSPTALKSEHARSMYYAQTIPAIGIKARSTPNLRHAPISGPQSLIPNGLWPVLQANYTVDTVEVFVNAAACLLTQSSTREILSIAARTSHPSAYTSGWVLSTGDHKSLRDIPSWVPLLGSWTVRSSPSDVCGMIISTNANFTNSRQSRVNELLVSRTSSAFRAGRRAEPSPKVSHDGRALHLETETFDEIGCFVMEGDFGDLIPQQLKDLLIALLNACDLSKAFHKYEVYPVNPIDALSRILLDAQKQDASNMLEYASTWLCHALARAVFKQLDHGRREQYENGPRRFGHTNKTSDEFEDFFINHHKRECREMDELLDLFEEILVRFPDEPWPHWAKSPRKFDMNIHIEHLENQTYSGQNDSERKSVDSMQIDAQDGSVHTSALKFVREEMESLIGMHANVSERFLKTVAAIEREAAWPANPPTTGIKLQSSSFQPQHQELHAQITNIVKSTLAWKKIFVTNLGLFGYGPKWLAGGETVMLVCGADVPYVFTPLEMDQRARAQGIRAELDVNDETYYKAREELRKMKKQSILRPLDALWHDRLQGKLRRLEKERQELQQEFDRLSKEKQVPDAWVLSGEVYIEGIMHGEAVRGSDRRQRIAVV
jgi:hypothetical protein